MPDDLVNGATLSLPFGLTQPPHLKSSIGVTFDGDESRRAVSAPPTVVATTRPVADVFGFEVAALFARFESAVYIVSHGSG